MQPVTEAGSAQAVAPSEGAVTKVDAALVNLRARALDIHARLRELRDAACMMRDGVGQGRAATWTTFLDKYDSLSKLFSQLTDELDRSLMEAGLQNFVTLPRLTTEDPAVLPDLLRTKLDPEVERDFQELQKVAAAERGESGTSSLSAAARITAYNDAIEAALDQFLELRESLSTSRPAESQPPRPSENADVVLAAYTKGQGITW